MKSEFSEKLSALRRGKSLSQRQAAAELGISQALLSHYENGAREPKQEFVIKACDYYSVPADYLLGRSEDQRNEMARLKKSVREVLEEIEKLRMSEADLIQKLKQLMDKQ